MKWTKNRIMARIARDQCRLAKIEQEEKRAAVSQSTPVLRKRTRDSEKQSPVTQQTKRTKADEAEQRVVIKYFYRKLSSPPEEDCDGHYGTVSEIRRMMGDSSAIRGSITQRANELCRM